MPGRRIQNCTRYSMRMFTCKTGNFTKTPFHSKQPESAETRCAQTVRVFRSEWNVVLGNSAVLHATMRMLYLVQFWMRLSGKRTALLLNFRPQPIGMLPGPMAKLNDIARE